MNTRDKLVSKCTELKDLLLEKNEAYGDAALKPLNIFASANAEYGIRQRIDDKLKRIQNVGLNDCTEDTLMDLAGYMILLPICSGNPALGIAEKRALGAARRILPRIRKICTGPPEQFTPITSAPQLMRVSTTCSGVSPSKVLSSRVNVIEAIIGRSQIAFAALIPSDISFKSLIVSRISKSTPAL